MVYHGIESTSIKKYIKLFPCFKGLFCKTQRHLTPQKLVDPTRFTELHLYGPKGPHSILRSLLSLHVLKNFHMAQKDITSQNLVNPTITKLFWKTKRTSHLRSLLILWALRNCFVWPKRTSLLRSLLILHTGFTDLFHKTQKDFHSSEVY